MMACAFTGPMPGRPSRSSLLAVLMLMAARANAENKRPTSSRSNRVMSSSKGPKPCSEPDRDRPGHALTPDHLRGLTSGRGEQAADVARDTVVDGDGRRGIARFAQLTEVGLGEALVLADELGRERNVLDRSAAMQIVEAKRGL